MKRNLPVVGAWILLSLLSFGAVVYSVLAAASAALYYDSRYRQADGDPIRALKLAREAHALYPHNYLLCVAMGKRAFYVDPQAPDQEGWRAEADRWSERAYALCPFDSEAAHLRTEVLARVALPRAVALWEQYRDRVFWEPFNQWMMLDLYVRAGQLDKASEALYWLKDTPYFEKADGMVRGAIARQHAASRH